MIRPNIGPELTRLQVQEIHERVSHRRRIPKPRRVWRRQR